MKALNYFNPKYLFVLLFDLFCNNLLNEGAVNLETGKKSSFSNPELSDLEVLVQWEDLTKALEHNTDYLKAVNVLETASLTTIGLKPKKDYLIHIMLSHEMMRSLTARYSNPSDYLLN